MMFRCVFAYVSSLSRLERFTTIRIYMLSSATKFIGSNGPRCRPRLTRTSQARLSHIYEICLESFAVMLQTTHTERERLYSISRYWLVLIYFRFQEPGLATQ
jgi:hypothetical protein